MPDDLSSIEGLADKHLRALARQNVTDLRGLVQADRCVIYRAMANLRPRPTLEQISRWQDDARSKLGKTGPAASDWQMAASFVVVFSQRQADDTWERSVEAERTEVEPERNRRVWPGWDAQPVCDWMVGQLSQADSAGVRPVEEPPRGRATRRGSRRGASRWSPPCRFRRLAPGRGCVSTAPRSSTRLARRTW